MDVVCRTRVGYEWRIKPQALQPRLKKEQVLMNFSQIVPIVNGGDGIKARRAVGVHVALRLSQAFGNLVDHLLKSFRSERRARICPDQRLRAAATGRQ